VLPEQALRPDQVVSHQGQAAVVALVVAPADQVAPVDVQAVVAEDGASIRRGVGFVPSV
jgi:hypothetical protein